MFWYLIAFVIQEFAPLQKLLETAVQHEFISSSQGTPAFFTLNIESTSSLGWSVFYLLQSRPVQKSAFHQNKDIFHALSQCLLHYNKKIVKKKKKKIGE